MSSSSSSALKVGDKIWSKTQPYEFQVGDKVEAKFRGKGSRWYQGEILKVRLDDYSGQSFDIKYDDGDTDVGLPSEAMRKLDVQMATVASSNLGTAAAKGQGRVSVKFPSKPAHSFATCMTSTKPLCQVGDKVEAKFRGNGSSWYKGEVSSVRVSDYGGRSFDVKYDDGDIDIDLPPEAIRKLDSPSAMSAPTYSPFVTAKEDMDVVSPPATTRTTLSRALFHVGDKVEAKYRGRNSRWYKGAISKVRVNHDDNYSFDVYYDDGDTDFGLPLEAIRKLEGLSAGAVSMNPFKVRATEHRKPSVDSTPELQAIVTAVVNSPSHSIPSKASFRSGEVEAEDKMDGVADAMLTTSENSQTNHDVAEGNSLQRDAEYPSSTQARLCAVGDKVKVKVFADRTGWCNGTIVGMRILYDVQYENGQVCKGMEGDLIGEQIFNKSVGEKA